MNRTQRKGGVGMKESEIKHHGDRLYGALRNRTTIPPLTSTIDDLNLDDAYAISNHLLSRRLEDGERLIGKKIGVTSEAVQRMLGVFQPDFGYLTDAMTIPSGGVLPISETMIQPRAEGEIAFVLRDTLEGPGITDADVVAATDFVMPCFEVVDSRIEDWNIKIEDTVADNASCGAFVLGDQAVRIDEVDLTTTGMVVYKNGRLLSTGAGAAALGSPIRCVTWLANTLGRHGIALNAGDIILSGSLVPLEPVVAGDTMRLMLGGVGSASIRFC